MKIYIIVNDYWHTLGIMEFAKVTSDYAKALEYKATQNDSSIRIQEIELERISNGEFFVGSYYEKVPDRHSYLGIYYSFDEAKRQCGKDASILSYNLANI